MKGYAPIILMLILIFHCICASCVNDFFVLLLYEFLVLTFWFHIVNINITFSSSFHDFLCIPLLTILFGVSIVYVRPLLMTLFVLFLYVLLVLTFWFWFPHCQCLTLWSMWVYVHPVLGKNHQAQLWCFKPKIKPNFKMLRLATIVCVKTPQLRSMISSSYGMNALASTRVSTIILTRIGSESYGE